MKLQRVPLLVLAFLMVACSSRALKISSEPAEAILVNDANEELGKTPLTLESEALEKAMGNNSFLSVTLRKEGFEPLRVLLEVQRIDDVSLKLTALDPAHFRSSTLRDNSEGAHKMLKDFLIAQGALGARRLEYADKLIADLQKNYPSMAPAFVLEADLRLAQKRKPEAIKALAQALKLAPQDAQIRQNLLRLGVKP